MISTFPPLVFSCRQEYKERKAAANMPPKPDKSIWQPKRKHKKKKRIEEMIANHVYFVLLIENRINVD